MKFIPQLIILTHRFDVKQYELATHTVKVRRSGILSDVSALWDTNNVSMVTGCAQSHLSAAKLKIERLTSINCFNQACVSSLLNIFRLYEKIMFPLLNTGDMILSC